MCPVLPKVITCKGLRTINQYLKSAADVKLYFGPYGPSWFQEISSIQMSAADELSISIAEDFAEQTVYRTEKCLRGIGIDPVPSPTKIRETMALCHMNDIAFLWFLMELYYGTPAKKGREREFSLNERLILNSICHLDMITTLRGLDAVLPPPPQLALTPRRLRNIPKTPQKYKSPYLEPLTKPHIPQSRRLSKPSIPDPSFKPYNKYEDPQHVVDNEQSRWFQSHSEPLICKDLILCECCPLNRGCLERTKYEYALFLDFKDDTRCYCYKDHKNNAAAPVLFYAQLNAAKSSLEYKEMLRRFIRQTVAKELVMALLFGKQELTNIHVCINCPKCQRDFITLKNTRKQIRNRRLRFAYGPDYEVMRKSVFGRDGPVGLLRTFNDIAKEHKEIVDVCVKDIWKLNMFLWSDCPENECDCLSSYPSSPDPNNGKHMNDMLRKALNELRKDSKYIIPFLPDAFKLPILQQWIRCRYGIKYSREVRARELHDAEVNWKFLDNLKPPFNLRIPTPFDVYDGKTRLHYGQVEDVLKCVSRIRRAYFERLDLCLVNDGRRLWPTLSPYLCSPNGTPRHLFYAYMPYKNHDTTKIRP